MVCAKVVYFLLFYFKVFVDTAWKVSVFRIILVRIFPHSDWIQTDTEYLSLNVGKYGQNNSEYGHFLRSVKDDIFTC